VNALPENTPWAAGLTLDAGSTRRRRATNAAIWTASVVAHAAVLALIASRFGAKRVEPPAVPPIAIEVIAPARPSPAATPPAPQPQKPPPRPAPHPVAKAVPPKVRAPLAPAVQPTERASPKAPDVAPAQPAPPSAAPAPTPPAPAPEPVVTPPVGNAAYLHNPAPRYPEAAQEEGWEGRVVLRVHVDAAGHPVSVDLHASSGHEVLDKAALAAVRRWTFVPAKRGSTPIDGWVDVPLDFRLN